MNAKTDTVDARVVEQFGDFLEPATIPLQELALEKLKELFATRRGLVRQGTRIANRSETVTSRLPKRQFRQSGELVKRQIAQIGNIDHYPKLAWIRTGHALADL